MEFLVVLDCLWVQREPRLVSAVCEDLEPLVEGGLLLLEQDVPAFEEAKSTLLLDARVVLLFGGGQRGGVGRGRLSWRRQGGGDLGIVDNTQITAF